MIVDAGLTFPHQIFVYETLIFNNNTMILKSRPVESKNFKDYKQFLDKKDYDNIKSLAKSLKGKKIVHVNATPVGGGVVTTLRGVIPLEQSLGLDSSWYTIQAPDQFFIITKKIHNSLQGDGEILSDAEKQYYLDINKKIANSLKDLSADIYFIHDPQPLASLNFIERQKLNAQFILRIHIDLVEATKDTLMFFEPYMKQYDRVLFMLEDFVPKNFPKDKYELILNAIDPLDPINVGTIEGAPKAILSQFGIHPENPLIAQVSRFDPWKDPLGVIDAYYMAKNDISELQLILTGVFEAEDDPEAKAVYDIVEKHAKGDPDIFMFAKPEKLGGLSTSAIANTVQHAADIILQKSLKEGFGLTVSEAMWKYKPVIGGNVGGIKKQIIDGKSGFLVNSPKEASQRIVELLKNKKLREKIGMAAHERVRKHFLVTRHVKDHLNLYKSLFKIK